MMKKMLLILLILLVAVPSAFSLDFREAKKMSKKQEKEVLYKIVSMASVSIENKIFCISFFDSVIQIKTINVINGDTILFTGAKIKNRVYISVDMIDEAPKENKTVRSIKTEHFRLLKNKEGWESLGESSPTIWENKKSEEKTQEG